MKQETYLLDVWYFNDGTLKEPFEIWFVVTKTRGYEEYLKVKEQSSEIRFNPYSESLLSSMFRNW
ncbi:hypothetical protein MKZ20_08425 [Psychrobacillus sp. FSL K6-2684]|jgi:hypothetical protein|uniref:hypothetical protein n=1 Tax=unclassified Psychrobacillus TaxID=2636677 RepID=UPI0011AAC267|nr:hypothetical protein [Psychrobacillus sp. AK 1817]QEY19943.1 hypothetical protein D0S48_04100 [Psychrobacillus sp. AK 1817]